MATATASTLPPLNELIELHDWETIQKGWGEIRKHLIRDDGYGYIMINTSIKSLLMVATYNNNGQAQQGEDNEFFPLDIVQKLFHQRRELIKSNTIVKKFFKEQWKSSKGGVRHNFHDRLLQFVCCDCPFEVLTKQLPVQVLEIVLEEYMVYFGNDDDDDDDHDSEEEDNAAWVVSKMWTPIIRRMMKLSDSESSSNGDENKKRPSRSFSIKTIFDELSNIKDVTNNNEICKLWERTKLFIRLCKPNKDMPLLHCSVMGGFPLLIVGLISMMYPHQLYQRDETTGRIPLHYAYQVPMKVLLDDSTIGNNKKNVVSLGDHYEFWSDIFVGNEKCNNKDNIEESPPHNKYYSSFSLSYVQLLLHMYPKGAIYADKQGKLPLSLYLERATCSTSRTSTIRRRGNNSLDEYSRMKADIQRLIDTEPECLSTRDTTTHLLPFMILPSSSSSTTTKEDDDDDKYSVSLTYEILQMNPTSLCFASANNNQSSSSTTTLDSFHVQNLKKRIRSESTMHKKKIAKLEHKLVCANETISNQQKEINRLQALLRNGGGR